jgi:hypothetical protein
LAWEYCKFKFLISGDDVSKNEGLYMNGMLVKMEVFIGMVVPGSATQKLKNVTAQPKWSTQLMTPQTIFLAWY